LHKPKYLLDVNVLVALTDEAHLHHKTAAEWFARPGLDWGLCAFSETGLLRISMNPKVGNLTIGEATAMLAALTRLPGYRYWPITSGWVVLAEPFGERVFGHRQITDAYLLGLAIKENGVLVTLDRAILYMAGPKYSKHLLVLES
jgi:toxin-antitoxin system PIN domain toxin